MQNNLEIPDDLVPDGAGQKLWGWLGEQCEDLAGCSPLVAELCRTADRLQEVRAKLKQTGLFISGPRGRSSRNPLLDAEAKLTKTYLQLWRSLGLADKQGDE